MVPTPCVQVFFSMSCLLWSLFIGLIKKTTFLLMMQMINIFNWLRELHETAKQRRNLAPGLLFEFLRI